MADGGAGGMEFKRRASEGEMSW